MNSEPKHQPQQANDAANVALGVELLAEREAPQAWEYDAQILWADAGTDVARPSSRELTPHAPHAPHSGTRLQRIVLRLSWADYQHWSRDGAVPPSRVADAVLRFIARHPAAFAGIESIDASTARRRVRGADDAIRGLLAGDEG
jgi:hypothetical protein